MKIKSKIVTAAVALAAGIALTGCEIESSAQEKEDASRTKTYTNLVKSQPAETMKYSPTRETKNFWIRTWDEKGKLSYVYLMNGSGDVFGYFILEGLPVSYCTGLIPPVKVDSDTDGKALVPQPSIDGTYSSGSNCSAFYGKDAVSGAYMEYTVGMGINALIFDQPMSQFGAAEPLGDATVSTAKRGK